MTPCAIGSPRGAQNLSGIGSKFNFNMTGSNRPRDLSLTGRTHFSNVANIRTLTLSAISASGHLCLAFSYKCRCRGLAKAVLSALGTGGIGTTFFIALDCVRGGPRFIHHVVSRKRVINGRDTARPIFPSVSHARVTRRLCHISTRLRARFNCADHCFHFPANTGSRGTLRLIASINCGDVF